MTQTGTALCPRPHPSTCEAPVCNVEHELELPDLVLPLPLLIFLFVTILLCFNGLLLLGFGVICGRTDPPSSIHPKGTAQGPLSPKHWGPKGKRESHLPTRKGLTAQRDLKETSQQPPLSILSREGCSKPECPSTKSGPPGNRGDVGDCENAAYVEGGQCRLGALIWGRPFQNIPALRRTQAAS